MAQPDSLWSVASNSKIATLVERSTTNILLPLNPNFNSTVEVISGSLPAGLRLSQNTTRIEGTVYEVAYNTTSKFVVRATYEDKFEDRTIQIDVSGPDDPVWQTNTGLLPVGSNESLFILDNEQIDFQLVATDTDISAGDELEYFIAEGDGTLPPGVTLSSSGKLTGIVEPLLSLDKRYQAGGYDEAPYGALPSDYGTVSANGYGSFFYDTVDFDFAESAVNPRKLNRYYPFRVTVTDGQSFVTRDFKIYLVGDDYLKADNTIMQSSTGVFTADTTNVRTPVWLTPKNLGYKRANNYVTINLDIIDNTSLEGVVIYTLESTNDDGSKSILPPGTTLDSQTGEIVGNIPYQPAITKDYKFTVRATRKTNDLDTVAINANYYEDTLLGKDSFKIYKIDLTGDIDGVNDLLELIGRDILLENRTYSVTNVDARNEDYDIIFLDSTLSPSISLITSRTALVGQDAVFVNRLSEANKDKYRGRSLRLSDSEVYVINDIVNYIEWDIQQITPGNDQIYPNGSPRRIQDGINYFIGDLVVYGTEVGGNDRVYRATETHTVQAQQDPITEQLIKVDGITQIVFESAKWSEVVEDQDDLSLADRVLGLKQSLEAAYGHTAYVDVFNEQNWRVRVPSTSLSRIAKNIEEFFRSGDDSTRINVTKVKDNEDRIKFDVNLSTQFNQGRNIGIALFRNEGFVENIVVAANDEVDIPSTPKTFDLKVIGEIDSNITWISNANLGTVNANFNSYLKVVAQTTVPDSPMIYTLKSGRLPFGMQLSYNGDITGNPRQYQTTEGPGLTLFDNKVTTFDGFLKNTTFDRSFKFVIEARDRFGYTAIEKEFTLNVADLDNVTYTDIYARPMLPEIQRRNFRTFTSDPEIFPPQSIYRPQDKVFGVKNILEMLIYAGAEAKKIEHFVAAAAKNHKRKQYSVGEVKSAKAIDPDTKEEIYEVVYLEVIDPAVPKTGKTRKSFSINTTKNITVDSIQYAIRDDETRTGAGYELLPVYGRQQVRFVYAEDGKIIVETRDSDVLFDVDNADFELDIREGEDAVITLQQSDADPYRLRPDTNTIKADSNAVKVSQSKDNIRYISSIDNIRDNIKAVGKNERNYLPLWMRTSQEGFQELDYISAIPICYVNPGQAATIIDNIKNSNFDFRQFNLDIDRYIIRRTEDYENEQYILFANYAYNV